jgi:hypothetical protein
MKPVARHTFALESRMAMQGYLLLVHRHPSREAINDEIVRSRHEVSAVVETGIELKSWLNKHRSNLPKDEYAI